VHDGKAGLPFLRDLWTQLTTTLPVGATVRFRMDGAFFRQAAVARDPRGRLCHQRCRSITGSISSSTFAPPPPGITGFVVRAATTPWGRTIRVAIYRKHVQHRATKNYQLDLFDLNNGHYE
jgi:hypothetical protein